jgi:hypothetical protein
VLQLTVDDSADDDGASDATTALQPLPDFAFDQSRT